MASAIPRVNPDATVALYCALATHAGVRRPVTVEDPRSPATSSSATRPRFAVIASHADEPLTVKPLLGEASRLAALGDAEVVDGSPWARSGSRSFKSSPS